MMEARSKKVGSVRLTDAQYEEMDRLGIDNESSYVRYKLDQAQSKLEVLKTPLQNNSVKTLPVTAQLSKGNAMEDKLTIQRLAMENRQLQEKLEAIQRNNQETLSGVSSQVHSLLQEELQKRDYEQLKKEAAKQQDTIKELQNGLNETKKEVESKQEEIEALVKKLGLVELGKALLPGAISGLAKQYPNQMKGIANSLGSLGLGLNETDTNSNNEPETEQKELLQIMEYFREVFTEEQFEAVVQLIVQMGDQIKDDNKLIQKVHYFLNQNHSPRPPKGGQDG